MSESAIPPSVWRSRSGWLILSRLVWIILAFTAVAFLVNALVTNGAGWWLARLEDCPPGLFQTCQENYQTWDRLGLTVQFWAIYYSLGAALETLPAVLVGILIFWRKSDDRFRFLFSLMLVLWGALGIEGFVFNINRDAYPVLAPLLVSLSTLGSMLLVLWYCFPDGRFTPRWTRGLAGLWIATRLLTLVFPGSPLDLYTWPALISNNIDNAFVVTLIGSLLYRYRLSQSLVQRQQIKWVVVCGILFGIYWIIDPFVNEQLRLSGTAYALTLLPLRYFLNALLAASFGISILRYHLWDIDVIIRRTLIYGALTVTLSMVYFASVILIQRIFPSGSQVSIVLSTLFIAALFTPLRRRIQRDIDRRFYRRKYDTEKVLTSFSNSLREEVDLDQLVQRTTAVLEETMQPQHISLWLRPPKWRKT